MYSQYSFLIESPYYIYEGERLDRFKRWGKRTAAGLALAGSMMTPLPKAYYSKHPGETTVGKAVVSRIMDPNTYKIKNFGDNFKRGVRMGIGQMSSIDPDVSKVDDIKEFNNLIRKATHQKSATNAFTTGFIGK